MRKEIKNRFKTMRQIFEDRQRKLNMQITVVLKEETQWTGIEQMLKLQKIFLK